MAKFTVRQGKRYQAAIRLGFVQSWASNEAVAGRFQEVGFTEVEVTGSGRNRLAKGLWARPDASADLPPEIVPPVRELEV
jgi:hypothetical protein